MFDLREKIVEDMKKNTHPPAHADETKICTSKKTDENAQNVNQDNVKCANENCTLLHIFKTQIKEVLDEKLIDVEIAQQTFEFLQVKGTATEQDIVNYIHETVDPYDFNNETTPLKIKRHLNNMFMHDLLEFTGNRYELTPEFVDLVQAARGEHK